MATAMVPIYPASVLTTSQQGWREYGLRDAIEGAWMKVGVVRAEDADSGNLAGFSELVESLQNGNMKRQMASVAHRLNNHDNTNPVTNQLIKRLFISMYAGNVKIVYRRCDDGIFYHAKKEVTVTCGTYAARSFISLVSDRYLSSFHSPYTTVFGNRGLYVLEHSMGRNCY